MMTDAVPVVNAGYNGFGDNDGCWFMWIIVLFALFGGNGWGNNFNRGAEQIDIDTRFLERDIFNTNQNVSNTAATTQNEILASSCQTQRDVLENRYVNQLGVQEIIGSQKDCCLSS